MSIKSRLMPRIKGESKSYIPRDSSDDARICLECPLPAEKCKPGTCRRYKEEREKMLKKHSGVEVEL